MKIHTVETVVETAATPETVATPETAAATMADLIPAKINTLHVFPAIRYLLSVCVLR